MSISSLPSGFLSRARSLFAPRGILFHDGRRLRRVKVGAGAQATAATLGAMLLSLSGYGVAQAADQVGGGPATVDGRVRAMEHQVATLRSRVATIRQVAALHAKRIEGRQDLLATALTGKGEARQVALATLAIDPKADRVAAAAVSPYARVEGRQVVLAAQAQRLLQQHYAATAATVRQLGLTPERVAVRHTAPAMGGPLIPAGSAEAAADIRADQQFRTLFQTWKKLDGLQQGVIAIPSVHPVVKLAFTSNFGIRSDPFRGTAAFHAGVDIPGPVGTPVYATADGIVDRAERAGGYGNMVEVDHGKGIATRYGHLSKILVTDGEKVHRGQLIALMGSTGRSTGPHLHYEVRIDGHAVNPVPFLTTADYLLAAQDKAVQAVPVSMDGPAPQD